MLRILCLAISLCLCVTGCTIEKIQQTALNGYERVTNWSFMGIRKEVQRAYTTTILVGTVSCAGATGGAPLVVAAYANNGQTCDIAHYTLLHEPGPFELLVVAGDYMIVGFVDQNGDLTYQPGEPAGQYRDRPLGVDETSNLVLDINIMLYPPGSADIDFPAGTAVTNHLPEYPVYTSPGAVADLDDSVFDPENGASGYWHPMDFFRRFGGNIYFLEPYDSMKVPVLFVHGATGSPRGWQPLIEKIDRNQYQPWFYYYPSGWSIKSMGDLLFWKLLNLKLKYHFSQIHLVAHSMGGLVARSFLVDYGKTFPEVRTLTSIATPWGGDSMAGKGAQHSPVMLPVWSDIDPDSEFFKSIYRRSLPSDMAFHLFFAHRGSRSLLRSNPFVGNNDGVIALSSQLDPRAQSEAISVYGLDEDHDSILLNDTLSFKISRIFETHHADQASDEKPALGKLSVRYTYADEASATDVVPFMVLTPTDKKRENNILIRLIGPEKTHALGPFPAGAYKATILADVFRASPVQADVVIRPGKTPVLEFVLTPDGWLGGYIAKTMHGEKNPPGVYLPIDEGVQVQSVRLTGEGIDRTLWPETEKHNFSVTSVNLSPGTDWAAGGAFCFYHLPKGKYRLTINADGFEPYTQCWQVIPGRATSPKGIKLTPLLSTER